MIRDIMEESLKAFDQKLVLSKHVEVFTWLRLRIGIFHFKGKRGERHRECSSDTPNINQFCMSNCFGDVFLIRCFLCSKSILQMKMEKLT